MKLFASPLTNGNKKTKMGLRTAEMMVETWRAKQISLENTTVAKIKEPMSRPGFFVEFLQIRRG